MALLMHVRRLPIWATVYSVTVWWLIWSPTEELTYQAYVLPRLRVLTGRTWGVPHCWLLLVGAALRVAHNPRLAIRVLSLSVIPSRSAGADVPLLEKAASGTADRRALADEYSGYSRAGVVLVLQR